jgi:hypothetical protein
MVILLMVIGGYFFMAIGAYSINGYWCLLMVIILMTIDGY